MKNMLERMMIWLLKLIRADLLAHAHVQIGVGHNTYNSGEEFVIKTLLSEILKKPPLVIIDVGANVGDYSSLLRSKFPTAKIHCFEPIPETFKQLVSNTKHMNIQCHNVAVGSSNEKINFFRGSNDNDGTMVTAYKEAINDLFTFAGASEENIVCDTVALDDFFANKELTIDFLKIDVEGHELEVLKGTTKMIKANKIAVMQFEFNEFNIFSRSFFYDYYKILPQYKFYRIMPQNRLYPLGEYNSAHEIFRYQNILAINNSLNYVYRS
ncbi:MAG: FkbM family methyltransferase [Bacteroidota bacterium]